MKNNIRFFFGEIWCAINHILLVLIFTIVLGAGISGLLLWLMDIGAMINFVIGVGSGILVSLLFYIGNFIFQNRVLKEDVCILLNEFYIGYASDNTYKKLSEIFTESNRLRFVRVASKLRYKYNYNCLLTTFLMIQEQIENLNEIEISNDAIKLNKNLKNFDYQIDVFFGTKSKG